MSGAADDGIVVPGDEKDGTGVLRNGFQDVSERLTDRHGPFGFEVQDGDDGIVGPVVIEGHGSACTIGHGEIAPGEVGEAGAHQVAWQVPEVDLQRDVAAEVIRIACEDEAGGIGGMVLGEAGEVLGAEGVTDEQNF